MARAAIHGGLCTGDGYASDRWKTAEVISNIGSTAGMLYLRDYVTYQDNTTEEIETAVYPYPSFPMPPLQLYKEVQACLP